MSNPLFPSGPWVGFYNYGSRTQKYMMDLRLEFKNGKMTGEGADGIGLFIISGGYSEQSGECNWVKQYVGRHAVDYRGFRDGKGIWGTWTISSTKGGFHIWPLSENGPANVAVESKPEEKPALTTK